MLRLTDVTKGFVAPDGRRRLVVDVPSFALDRGEHVGLVGASGSGKTTLLHLVSGILAADSGRIELAGHDLVTLDEPARDAVRARHVGYVFQTFNLLGGYSALENVELGQSFGRGADPQRAVTLLERLGLGGHLDHRPHQLSAGQQQRVALARALAHRPDLVLADEPTGALDPERAHEAVALLREACREQGAALLLVSHDHGLLRDLDRVVALADLNRAAPGSAS